MCASESMGHESCEFLNHCRRSCPRTFSSLKRCDLGFPMSSVPKKHRRAFHMCRGGQRVEFLFRGHSLSRSHIRRLPPISSVGNLTPARRHPPSPTSSVAFGIARDRVDALDARVLGPGTCTPGGGETVREKSHHPPSAASVEGQWCTTVLTKRPPGCVSLPASHSPIHLCSRARASNLARVIRRPSCATLHAATPRARSTEL